MNPADDVTINHHPIIPGILHDMKMPLQIQMNCIRLIESRLEDQPDTYGAISEDLDMMMSNCYRLLRMIDNLVTLSNVSQGTMSLNRSQFDLLHELDTLCMLCEGYAKQSGITLSFFCDACSIPFSGDREKIERMMLNLLSNAIRYTPSGGRIDVTLRRRDHIEICVEDTGPGIDQKIIDRLFDPFVSSENSSLQGTGLGLNIAQAIANLHNGLIRVHSTPGAGSRFTVAMPCDNTAAPAGYSFAEIMAERIKTEFC